MTCAFSQQNRPPSRNLEVNQLTSCILLHSRSMIASGKISILNGVFPMNNKTPGSLTSSCQFSRNQTIWSTMPSSDDSSVGWRSRCMCMIRLQRHIEGVARIGPLSLLDGWLAAVGWDCGLASDVTKDWWRGCHATRFRSRRGKRVRFAGLMGLTPRVRQTPRIRQQSGRRRLR